MHKLQHTKRNYITCDKNLRLLLFSKFLLRIYSERSIIVWFSSHRCVVLERYSPFPLLYASRRETVFFPYNGTISVEFLFFFSPFRLNCTFAWCCILFGLLLHFETLKHKTSTCTYCTTLLTISFSLVNTKINYLVHVWHSYKFCNATLTMVPLIHTYAHTLE